MPQLVFGSAMLALVFLGHSVVLLVFEPAMGFDEFSDFFDLALVVPALSSIVWKISNLLHLLLAVGLLVLACGVQSSAWSRPTLTAAFGFAAAPLFFVVGMSGFVGEQLLTLLTNPVEREAALLGLLMGTRTAVLYAAVGLLGCMILSANLWASGFPVWLRVLGAVVGLAALAFVFIPTPVPLLLFIWFTAQAICFRR